MKYNVHVRQDWVYEIEADSPDDAASTFEYDPPDHGDCTGYGIEAVTTLDDLHGETDLREPLICRGCSKTLPPTSNGECIKCLLARLERQADLSVSVPEAQQDGYDEQSLADDRNDDAWLEDRGLL